MTEYALWTPEHDGHLPPFWDEGMKWDCTPWYDWDTMKVIAFPPSWLKDVEYRVPIEAVNPPETSPSIAPNMSLRDYFAGQALPQAMAALGYNDSGEYLSDTIMLKYWVANSYQVADAMLAERDKK